MKLNGPIILVEDDPDDRYIMGEIFDQLKVPNVIKFFRDGSSALEYLLHTSEYPFIIICDINLPGMSGIDLKRKIEQDAYLHMKCIPFIYLSTTYYPAAVREAYKLIVQGFFTKPSDFNACMEMMRSIVTYWKLCNHPMG